MKSRIAVFAAICAAFAFSAAAAQNSRPAIVDRVNVVYAFLPVPTVNFTLGAPPPQADTPECAMVKAVVNGNVDMVDALLEAGMDIDEPICLLEKSPYRSAASYRELQTGQVDLNRRFFKQISTASLSFSPVDSIVAPRHKWVGLAGDVSARESGVLFTVGPQGSAPGKTYTLFGTPLMIACRAKNKYMVRQLLERGANPNVFIQQNTVSDFTSCISARPWYSALRAVFGPADGREDIARRNDRTAAEIVKMLCSAGLCLAPQDVMGRNALWDALEDLSPLELEMALQKLDVNAQDHQGRSFADCLKEYESKSATMKNGRYVKRTCRAMRESLEKRGLVEKDDGGMSTKHGDFIPAAMPDAVPSIPAAPAPSPSPSPTPSAPSPSPAAPAPSVPDFPVALPQTAPRMPQMTPSLPAPFPVSGGGGFSMPGNRGKRRCTGCRGTGACRACHGTGTSTSYGVSLPCDPKCAACGGRGWF